jgi:hypothetical protein
MERRIAPSCSALATGAALRVGSGEIEDEEAMP